MPDAPDTVVPEYGLRHRIALWTGPGLAAALILLGGDINDNPAITRMAAVALWMAIWWIGEAAPLAVTALLPMTLFPILGIMAGSKVATLYFNDIIFLFLGGFMIALALERWHLHKRIALMIIHAIGLGPKRLLFGFMLACAVLSMWMSNTATAMMMTPIALAVIWELEEDEGTNEIIEQFGAGLILGVAYAASIGGLGTLIGTPPNLSFVKKMDQYFPDAPGITFLNWMLFGTPLMLAMLFCAWWVISKQYCQSGHCGDLSANPELFENQRKALGPMGYEEKCILAVFSTTALLWMTRKGITIGDFSLSGWNGLFEGRVDDGTIAITMAMLLFLIPAKEKAKGFLMNWEDTARLPWGIALLFGGGFALATGMQDSGLDVYLGEQFKSLAVLPPVLLIAGVCAGMTALSEVATNIAAVEMTLPIFASTAIALKMNPLFLMIPATVAASFGFMLPVATAANAIAFGTQKVTMGQMVRTGFYLDLIGVVLATFFMFTLGLWVFGIDPNQMPDWAVLKPH